MIQRTYPECSNYFANGAYYLDRGSNNNIIQTNMRKLQHQNSCHVTGLEITDPANAPQHRTDLSSSPKELRGLEGKILLLEERGKGIQQFY